MNPQIFVIITITSSEAIQLDPDSANFTQDIKLSHETLSLKIELEEDNDLEDVMICIRNEQNLNPKN